MPSPEETSPPPDDQDVSGLSGIALGQWRHPGERSPDPLRFAAFLAQTLLDGGIFNVVWGDTAVDLWGIQSFFNGISFIVYDAELDQATALFKSIGLHTCPTGPSCESTLQHKYPPFWPPTHFHMKMFGGGVGSVMLYRQSDYLWELPPLSSLLEKSHKDVIATNLERQLDSEGKLNAAEEWKDAKGAYVPSLPILMRAFSLLHVRYHNVGRRFGILQCDLLKLARLGRWRFADAGPELQPYLSHYTPECPKGSSLLPKLTLTEDMLRVNAMTGPEEFRATHLGKK